MIIVTGASKGIGQAIGKHLTLKGKKILGLSRIPSKENFNTKKCDVSSYEEIKNIVKDIKSQNIKLEGIINAAGVASMNLAITTPKEKTQSLIQTNLAGTIYCCQLFAPLLIRNKSGFIINFSTIAVSLGLKGESIYVATKAGVEGFSRSFAREMSDFNININCIAPGPIDTNLIKGISDDKIQKILERQIFQKQFNLKNICDIIDILIDPKSNSITGQVLNIGGV